MNNDNYQFILADDHKGNKVLAVIKGELSTELVSNAKVVTDTRFNAVAEQLKKIIDSASVIEKDGEHSCN
ncbi:hypothetical protein [uncultured Lactobacillus sp.]|jgi:hypothetical protein|uniref:hypothetical protein n=1 Tax=uncultured Lactobacillus sp. TaxID=153152 RepID=UPI002805D530|nr:hypothetical protein [uncultured Lactobacillus sp.]